jgi:hypothetical protein
MELNLNGLSCSFCFEFFQENPPGPPLNHRHSLPPLRAKTQKNQIQQKNITIVAALKGWLGKWQIQFHSQPIKQRFCGVSMG